MIVDEKSCKFAALLDHFVRQKPRRRRCLRVGVYNVLCI